MGRWLETGQGTIDSKNEIDRVHETRRWYLQQRILQGFKVLGWAATNERCR